VILQEDLERVLIIFDFFGIWLTFSFFADYPALEAAYLLITIFEQSSRGSRFHALLELQPMVR